MQKPTFFGYGLTTRAIARKFGGGCNFFDDSCQETKVDEEGNNIFPSSKFNPDTSTLEILTPSIKPNHPLLAKAKNPISEYDYFLSDIHKVIRVAAVPTFSTHASEYRTTEQEEPNAQDSPFTIWISGTNGKTTTTQMLTHILAKRGAISGGNIGVPLADLDPTAPIWVLESSSYTLHHTKHASPNIYLLLPITPDHLDWHGSAKEYEADKLKPLLNMREGELALVPKGLSLPRTDAWVVEYDSNEFLEKFFDLDSSKLRYKAAFLQDALLSLAISRTLFEEADYSLLNEFTLDHHRQEEIADARGRLWVNDSKATNVDATVQAIEGYSNKPLHLVLGGDDKGVDLNPLMDLVSTKDITLYTIGSNSDKLSKMAEERAVAHYNCAHLEKAVSMIDKNLQVSEVALLSPAAASLDQFSSYIARGDLFKRLVCNLSDS